MNQLRREPSLSRGDAAALWLFIGAGIASFLYVLIRGIARVVELLRNTDVSVPAVFSSTPATAPLGVDGSPVTVELDRATLTVDALPIASVGAGILEVATVVIATGATVILLSLLCSELFRGRIFSRRNTRLVTAAGLTVLAGLILAPFFGNMVANGAFARLSEQTFDNVVISVNLSVLIGATFVAAFLTSVFAVGDRLQRETEGLV